MQLLFYCRASSAASNIKICSPYLHQREGCFSYMTDTDVLGPRWQVLGPGSVILHSLPSSTRCFCPCACHLMSPYIYVPWRLRKGETGKAASASPKSRQKKYLWTSSIALPLDCTATSGCERGWERRLCQPGMGTLLPWAESGLLIKEGSGNGCRVGTCSIRPGSCGNRGTLWEWGSVRMLCCGLVLVQTLFVTQIISSSQRYFPFPFSLAATGLPSDLLLPE